MPISRTATAMQNGIDDVTAARVAVVAKATVTPESIRRRASG